MDLAKNLSLLFAVALFTVSCSFLVVQAVTVIKTILQVTW